jgi:hypothetical protein
MSASTAEEAAGPVEVILPARWEPVALGFGAFLWFAFVADRFIASGEAAPLLAEVWRVQEDPAALAGQWLVATLLAIIRWIPNAGPQTLILATTLAGGLGFGMLYRMLRLNGWGWPEALLVMLLLAAHPGVLMLTTTGGTLLLSVLLVGVVVLCLDRAATVGDAQSLMALGLVLATMMLTAPDALYIALPIAVMLPFCLRGVQDFGSAAALYLITLFPSVIAIGGILLASATMGEAPAFALRRWLAPMHGAIDAAGTLWLEGNGGTFLDPFRKLLPLFVMAMPPSLMALLCLILRPTERRRPAAALLALMGGPLAGAGATLFWHAAGPLSGIAIGMAATLAWTTCRSFNLGERLLWTIWLGVGVSLTWSTAWIWSGPEPEIWRKALGV